MERGDALAHNHVAYWYFKGAKGLPEDPKRAVELWRKAAELGYMEAYYNLGNRYENGGGVEIDTEEAIRNYEIAAMGGIEEARYRLGLMENKKGNADRMAKHFVIAAKMGHNYALGMVKECYTKGWVTKEVFASTLRAYQASVDETKSEQREMARKFLDASPNPTEYL